MKSVLDLISEIKKCEAAGATTAAVTMALLGLPAGKDKQGRADFIAWVERYLKGHEDQPYKYRGLDVYGAPRGPSLLWH